MKAEIRQRWLEALRSEKYSQGRNLLRQEGNAFCCLGVLCDLVDPDGWRFEEGLGRYDHSGYVGHLPGAVGAVAGLVGDQCFTLMGMNDNGQSFAQIADWIEANIPTDAA